MATTWDPVDMEKTAFHEAGHAVVAWSLGARRTRIYLDLEKQGGEAISAVAPTRLCIVQQIAFHYAGPVSEKIFKGPASSPRARADHMNVHVLLEKNGTPEEEPEGQALQTRAYALVEKLLRRHEARIGRVAKRLLQPPHKMNPARFKRLMREG
jgi:Peptidase M50B-like